MRACVRWFVIVWLGCGEGLVGVLTLRVQVPNNHILSQIVTYITTIRNLST